MSRKFLCNFPLFVCPLSNSARKFIAKFSRFYCFTVSPVIPRTARHKAIQGLAGGGLGKTTRYVKRFVWFFLGNSPTAVVLNPAMFDGPVEG